MLIVFNYTRNFPLRLAMIILFKLKKAASVTRNGTVTICAFHFFFDTADEFPAIFWRIFHRQKSVAVN